MAPRYYAFAALLMLLGLIGLIGSSPLLGMVPLTPIQSLFHMVTGACAGYAATRGLGTMRLWGKILGFAYLAVAVADFVMHGGTTAWLHLAIALFFLYHALLAPPTL
jgi:hypothetical protein